MKTLWANAIAYQVVWFVAVIGAGHGLAWPGVLAALVFVAATLVGSPWRVKDVQLVLVSLLCGCVIDTALATLGWARYGAAMPPPGQTVAPLWILALWAAFSTTLTRSMGWLRPRLWLGTLLGALGGPLAYLGAARGWQAVEFEAPAWRGLLVLGVGWAVALTLLLRAARQRAS